MLTAEIRGHRSVRSFGCYKLTGACAGRFSAAFQGKCGCMKFIEPNLHLPWNAVENHQPKLRINLRTLTNP
jgi:hypothetical protein